jgi:hypothetical protein
MTEGVSQLEALTGGISDEEQAFVEKFFGKQSNLARQIIKAWGLAIAQADSLGEIRRIDRMAQAKLRSIGRAEYKADNV